VKGGKTISQFSLLPNLFELLNVIEAGLSLVDEIWHFSVGQHGATEAEELPILGPEILLESRSDIF